MRNKNKRYSDPSAKARRNGWVVVSSLAALIFITAAFVTRDAREGGLLSKIGHGLYDRLQAEHERNKPLPLIAAQKGKDTTSVVKPPPVVRVSPVVSEITSPSFAAVVTGAQSKEIRKWEKEARDGIAYARETGVFDVIVEAACAVGYPPEDALYLAHCESYFNKYAETPLSSAKGLLQPLEGRFLELFAEYGKEILPILKKMSPKLYKRTQPLVGKVRLDTSGPLATVVFEEKGIKAKEIKEAILALRNPDGISGAEKTILNALLVLDGRGKQRAKAPFWQRGIIINDDQLSHLLGESGAKAVFWAFKKNGNATMYDVMCRVYRNIKDDKKRDALVCDVLKGAGIVRAGEKGTLADKGMTVAGFMEKFSGKAKVMIPIYAQALKGDVRVAQLNKKLEELKAPFRVELLGEKSSKGLQRAALSSPKNG